MRSKIRWFTELCNSHYLSHFAAFFIDARTKRSVVESFNSFSAFAFFSEDTHGNSVVWGPPAGAWSGPEGAGAGPPKQLRYVHRGLAS